MSSASPDDFVDPFPAGPRTTAVILADYANAREGLLNIVSGGVSRILRPIPGPFGLPLHLAVHIYVPPDWIGRPFEMQVVIRWADGEGKALRATIGLSASFDAQLDAGEGAVVPFTMPLHGYVIDRSGQLDITVTLNPSRDHAMLSLWVIDPAPDP